MVSGTVLVHHLVRVDDVAQALGHLDDGMTGHLTVLLLQSLLGGLLAAVLLQQLVLLLEQIDEAVGFQAGSCRGRYAVVGLGSGLRRCRAGTYARNGCTAGAGWCAHAAVVPVHRNQCLQSLLGAMASLRSGPCSAGSTRKNQPHWGMVSVTGSRAAAAGAGGLDPVTSGPGEDSPSGPLKVGDVRQGQGRLLSGGAASRMCRSAPSGWARPSNADG